jgi:hypothetical protein
MELDQTNAEILRDFSDPRFQRRGLGLLITGPSKEKRSEMAELAQSLIDGPDRSVISVTVFEFIAGYHFGLSQRLRSDDILLIKDLGELSKAELDALDVIKPLWNPTWLLETILDQRAAWNRLTLITTEYELAELEAQFSDRLVSLVGSVGFSLRIED